MNNRELTLKYYNEQTEKFIKGTLNVDFSKIQNDFLKRIKPGGRILDLGCGAGRDSKAFIDKGYQVVAVDGSESLCRFASDYIGQEVICSTFEEYEPEGMFDGVWACASLLHLDYENIVAVMKKLTKNLVPGGCFYASFKYGDFSGERNGRYFIDLNESNFKSILVEIPELEIDDSYITIDVRPDREEPWLNVMLKKND